MRFSTIVILLIAFFAYKSFANGSSSTIWGPYHCKSSSCFLKTPVADIGTLAYIYTMDNYNYVYNSHPLGIFDRKPGDQFVICNDTHCVTYTRTASGDFMGGAPVERQTPREGGGSGDGPRPGGSGNNRGPNDLAPVGGCYAKCNPNVNVGKPKPV